MSQASSWILLFMSSFTLAQQSRNGLWPLCRKLRCNRVIYPKSHIQKATELGFEPRSFSRPCFSHNQVSHCHPRVTSPPQPHTARPGSTREQTKVKVILLKQKKKTLAGAPARSSGSRPGLLVGGKEGGEPPPTPCALRLLPSRGRVRDTPDPSFRR